jgi:hypothetical protein
MSNANLPSIEVYVFNSFLGIKDGKSTKGWLVSVRALPAQALQFTILLETGALFTGLPAHSITFEQFIVPISLQEAQMYDNIGSKIEVITLNMLKNMNVTLKTDTNLVEGKYLFSIDFIDGGFSGHSEQWKMFHVIQSFCGRMYIYPQYRLQFKDLAICPKSNEKLPQYSANTTLWEVGK